MKKLIFLPVLIFLTCCNSGVKENKASVPEIQGIKNEEIRTHVFLEPMQRDTYYPPFLVDKGKNILIGLCSNIELKKPQNTTQLLELTHKATQQFNELNNEFMLHQSEIETVAREAIAADIDFISKTYGFKADIEELISNRDW